MNIEEISYEKLYYLYKTKVHNKGILSAEYEELTKKQNKPSVLNLKKHTEYNKKVKKLVKEINEHIDAINKFKVNLDEKKYDIVNQLFKGNTQQFSEIKSNNVKNEILNLYKENSEEYNFLKNFEGNFYNIPDEVLSKLKGIDLSYVLYKLITNISVAMTNPIYMHNKFEYLLFDKSRKEFYFDATIEKLNIYRDNLAKKENDEMSALNQFPNSVENMMTLFNSFIEKNTNKNDFYRAVVGSINELLGEMQDKNSDSTNYSETYIYRQLIPKLDSYSKLKINTFDILNEFSEVFTFFTEDSPINTCLLYEIISQIHFLNELISIISKKNLTTKEILDINLFDDDVIEKINELGSKLISIIEMKLDLDRVSFETAIQEFERELDIEIIEIKKEKEEKRNKELVEVKMEAENLKNLI